MYVSTLTTQAGGGRIWSGGKPPADSKTGLLVALCTPSALTKAEVRTTSFFTVAFDASGQYLAAGTSRDTFLFAIGSNRYVRLDRAGVPGSCATFGTGHLLFVGYEDASIRAYNISKSTTVGILRSHRVAPQHLHIRKQTEELLSTSVDGAILWDAKKLHRKRGLGGGPYGATHACFTPDEGSVVAGFQDGSFYVWSAATWALERSFTLPVAPRLRVLQTTFALSGDGQLLVAAGPKLPFLLVYNLISGAFLHAVLLPDLVAISGATQLQFLPDSTTVAALCTDGSIHFLDVRQGLVVSTIPYAFPNRKDNCVFSMDERCNMLALVANGKVLVYDLSVVRANVVEVRPLQVVQPGHVEDVYSRVPMYLAGKAPKPEPHQDVGSRQGGGDQAGRSRAGPGEGKEAQPASTAEASKSKFVSHRGRSSSPPDTSAAAAGRKSRSPGRGGGLKGAAVGGVQLDRDRLTALLEQFGEYPAKYRLTIWSYLLRLPRNQLAFQSLILKGGHSAFSNLAAKMPMLSKGLAARLSHALSQLAHWCPVFSQASFLPALIFPFVKLHALGGTPLHSEATFEMLATLLISWMRGWFEKFPDPPLGVLSRLDALLSLHDNNLAAHLRMTVKGGVASLAWGLLQDAFSSALPQNDFLKLWDHCITAGPDFLYFFTAAYFMALRATILDMDTEHKICGYLGRGPAVDCNRVLRAAYELRLRTPPELQPTTRDWEPLPPTGDYTGFRGYPPAATELFAQERRRIVEAEEALARRRKIISELALRTKAVALQAGSLAAERQQLTALAHERREQLRQLEASMMAELQQLEDRAKEEKLKQIATIEHAHQHALGLMRQEWQLELDHLRKDVAARRHLLILQVQSKEEDEAIAKLQFAAHQKLTALEQDAAQQATLAKMRDEAQAQTAELEAWQRKKLREWETQDEASRLKAQHEDARARRSAQAVEDAAAQAAVRKEVIANRLAIEEQVLKVDAERRLRSLAEEQAALTRATVEKEAATAAARAAADEQALLLQAQADAGWLQREQHRRELALTLQRDKLRAAEEEAKARLGQTAAQVRLYSTQSALLNRRHTLEVINAEEEIQAQRVLDAMAVERGRAASLTQELRSKEEELAQALHLARRGTQEQQQEPMRADVDATSLVGPATGDEEEGQQEEDVGVNMADPVALKRMLQDVNVARVAAQQQVDQLRQQGGSDVHRSEIESLTQHLHGLQQRRQALEAALGVPVSEPFTPEQAAAVAAALPVPPRVQPGQGTRVIVNLGPRPAVQPQAGASQVPAAAGDQPGVGTSQAAGSSLRHESLIQEQADVPSAAATITLVPPSIPGHSQEVIGTGAASWPTLQLPAGQTLAAGAGKPGSSWGRVQQVNKAQPPASSTPGLQGPGSSGIQGTRGGATRGVASPASSEAASSLSASGIATSSLRGYGRVGGALVQTAVAQHTPGSSSATSALLRPAASSVSAGVGRDRGRTSVGASPPPGSPGELQSQPMQLATATTSSPLPLQPPAQPSLYPLSGAGRPVVTGAGAASGSAAPTPSSHQSLNAEAMRQVLMQRLMQAGPSRAALFDASSTGDMSDVDVDALILRLKRDLALTETEDDDDDESEMDLGQLDPLTPQTAALVHSLAGGAEPRPAPAAREGGRSEPSGHQQGQQAGTPLPWSQALREIGEALGASQPPR